MKTGRTDGPPLPRPTRKQIELGAALSGALKLIPDQQPDLFSALSYLLDIPLEEAAARFASYRAHTAVCWEIAESWGLERGLQLLGYTWHGDDEPVFGWLERQE